MALSVIPDILQPIPLASAHASGATTFALESGAGATIAAALAKVGYPSVSATAPLRFQVLPWSSQGVVGETTPAVTYKATGVSGDTLTGCTAVDGTTDRNWAAGDVVLTPWSAGAAKEFRDLLAGAIACDNDPPSSGVRLPVWVGSPTTGNGHWSTLEQGSGVTITQAADTITIAATGGGGGGGVAIGDTVTGGAAGDVLFLGGGSVLAQANDFAASSVSYNGGTRTRVVLGSIPNGVTLFGNRRLVLGDASTGEYVEFVAAGKRWAFGVGLSSDTDGTFAIFQTSDGWSGLSIDPTTRAITGNGSGLTSLNASNLSSGTVNAARLPDLSATYLTPAGNGSGLTGLTVSQVSGAAPLASPALTGTPTAPTATTGTNNTQVATTAFATSVYVSRFNATYAGITGVVYCTLGTIRAATASDIPDLSGTYAALAGASFTGKVTITGAPLVRPAVALTDGSTITLNCNSGDLFTLTLTGSGHTLNITNMAAGMAIRLRVVAGSYTLAGYSGATITWAGGSAPTFTTGGKADWLIFMGTGSGTCDAGVSLPNC